MSKIKSINNFKTILKLCPIENVYVTNNEIVLFVKPNIINDILLFFKYHCLLLYEILSCISGIDYPTNKYRFQISYELLSIKYNVRIRIKTFVNETVELKSCTNLFLVAGWYECELWDLFGIYFINNSNLKRILTDYGFNGYPLRKDFPLKGFIEVKYNEITKKLVRELIKSSQEYRTFSYLSPWELTTFSK